MWKLPPASIEGAHAQPERTLQTTPLATTVRPYAPGDSMNRIHWRSTARTGEIQVKEFDLEQTADAWIFLDLDAAHRGRAAATTSTTEVAVRAAASIADKALAENRAVGLTVNGHRMTVVPADRGARQRLKILQLLAAVEADGRTPLQEALVTGRQPAPAGDDGDRRHAVAGPGLRAAARDAPHPRHRDGRDARSTRRRSSPPRTRRRRRGPAPARARRAPRARRVRDADLRRRAHARTWPRRWPDDDRRLPLRRPAEGWMTLALVAALALIVAWAMDDPRWVNGKGELTDCLGHVRPARGRRRVRGPKVGWGRWTTHLMGALFAAILIPVVAGWTAYPGTSLVGRVPRGRRRARSRRTSTSPGAGSS